MPDTYDIDEALGGVKDDRMFGNDEYGDCVIAARAHQTLRFEKYEQGTQPEITDREVIDQYFEESGGLDTGLYLLNSLKVWRNKGWEVGGRNYTIYAFAGVDWRNHEEVKHCIHLLGGVNFGMLVYEKDMQQFREGKLWELTSNNGSFLGGHGVYLFHYEQEEEPSTCPFANGICWGLNLTSAKLGRKTRFKAIINYDQDGLTCMTWGRKQHMTWDFWDARIDEAYGIVDNRNDWLEDSPIDVEKLDAYLKEITR